MPTIEIRTQVSLDDLLAGVEQLPTPQLEAFISKALAVQAKRRAPGLSADESTLLQKINRGLPTNLRARLAELDEKRCAETLNENELQELQELTAQVEQLDAERVTYLGELARLRNTPLRALMKQLGIQRPAYA